LVYFKGWGCSHCLLKEGRSWGGEDSLIHVMNVQHYHFLRGVKGSKSKRLLKKPILYKTTKEIPNGL